MAQKSLPLSVTVTTLSELVDGQEGEFFSLLSEKQELKTRDGKPYYRVTFRDKGRDFRSFVSAAVSSGNPMVLTGEQMEWAVSRRARPVD